VASARTRRAIKSGRDLRWKGVKQGMRVLGCSPHALGDGDQRARPSARLNVPDLRLIESISVALCMVDGNGPAVASDTGDPRGWPVQLMGHQAHGRIRTVGLSVRDDHSWFPNVMEAMGVTVAVSGCVFALVSKRAGVNAGCCAVCERVPVLC